LRKFDLFYRDAKLKTQRSGYFLIFEINLSIYPHFTSHNPFVNTLTP